MMALEGKVSGLTKGIGLVVTGQTYHLGIYYQTTKVIYK